MLKNNFKHVTSVKILEENKVTNLSHYLFKIYLYYLRVKTIHSKTDSKKEERKKE